MSESVIQMITSISGGYVSGILAGYFVKKIIKILMFVVGGMVGLLLYLQQQQIVSLNLDKLEESSTFIFESLGSSFNNVNQVGDMSNLGIPLVGSLSAGFAVGFMKG